MRKRLRNITHERIASTSHDKKPLCRPRPMLNAPVLIIPLSGKFGRGLHIAISPKQVGAETCSRNNAAEPGFAF
jgi:hypothetical protein